MKTPVLTCALFAAVTAAYPQDPNITSWVINTDGTTAKFYVGSQLNDLGEEANVQRVCYDNDFIYVETEGLAEIMGPCQNPGTPSGQGHTWMIPRNPEAQTGTKTEAPIVASLGVLINGVPVYAKGDAKSYDPSTGSNEPMGQGIWNGEAYFNEGVSLDDKYSGHPQQDGEYHSHATPTLLYASTGTTNHSPLIGWAFDGYPIYGPYAYSDPNDPGSAIKLMETGYALRSITQRHTLPDGTTLSPSQYGPDVNGSHPLGMYLEDYEYTGNGDLDEYNGRMCVTPEFPDGTYAYFVTMESDGTPAFPYFIGTSFYGKVEDSNFGIMGGKTPTPASAECYDPLAIATVADAHHLNIYPNPSAGPITITDLGIRFRSLEVMDHTGRVLVRKTLNTANVQQEIDLSALPAGSYIVRLSGKGLVENKSIVLY